MPSLPLDWREVTEEAVTLLRGLLRIDTTNPPGNETPAAEFLGDYLRREGLEFKLLPSREGRANLVCRLRGDGSAGGPLLLNAHTDVVPARAEAWQRGPFSGDLHEGFLWGRGAIDMKHMAAMSAVVVARLKRSGVVLRRD